MKEVALAVERLSRAEMRGARVWPTPRIALTLPEPDWRTMIDLAGVRRLLDELRALGIPIIFDAEAVASLSPRLKLEGLITNDMFASVINCMYDAGVL